MPRIARIVYPELPHHITQRGNFKQNIFTSEDDIIQYLKLIKVANKHLKIEILAYCFMMNHVHFIMVPPEEESLAFFFNSLSMRYAQYFNRKLGRKGHLWQDRYYSCPLDLRHFYEAVRYVENNPVKAGIVRFAAEYRWSSASIHIDGNTSVMSTVNRRIQTMQFYPRIISCKLPLYFGLFIVPVIPPGCYFFFYGTNSIYSSIQTLFG